jgi:hypothetical protein
MLATLLLLFSFITLGLFLWATLGGALFFMGCLTWLIVLVITVGYIDKMVLFLLGAREVRSSDEKDFFEAASHEAYKLSVSMPRLYFYNGLLERAFILQHRNEISIVLNKGLLAKFTSEELKAICFELLLQVKKGMASKRTKSMFLLGFLSWSMHSIMGLLMLMIPSRNLRKSLDLSLNFFLHPFLELLFKFIISESYFKKLSQLLVNFPEEKELLDRVGLKLKKPTSYYSLPSRKLLELSSVNKSRHFQNIITLEFLPHEWDFLFQNEGMKRAE